MNTIATKTPTAAYPVEVHKLSDKQLKVMGLGNGDLEHIAQLVQDIDPMNPGTVNTFGRRAGEQTTAYADELLSQVRNGEVGQMGEQLVEVVGIAQKTNMNVLTGRRSNLPVIGPWIDKLKMRGMRLQNQFETSKEQIDKVITEVQTTVAGLSKRNETLEVMFDNVRKEYYELSVHIVAGRVALARVNQLIEQRQQTATNPAELQELSDMQAFASNLGLRIGNLEALQQSSLQMLPQIRVIQSTNFVLVDKFNTITTLTIPIWKRQFVLAMGLNESKNAAELTVAIDDFTNSMLTRGADLLHKNAVATAKSNQRLPIDVKTLQYVQDMLVKTANDVSQIQLEGKREREQSSMQIEHMCAQMKKQISTNSQNLGISRASAATGA